MRFGRVTSLQLSLALRITAFYAAAAAIVFGILVFRAYDVNATLDRRNLSIRAANLVLYVSVDPSGAARLELPPTLQAVYAARTSADIFAIRGPDRRVIAAVRPLWASLSRNGRMPQSRQTTSISKALAMMLWTIMA